MSVTTKLIPRATVGGLIFAPDQTLLLIKAPKWNNLWSLPGGKIDWGETMEDAFRREVMEETGLSLHHWRFAFTQESIYSPQFHEKAHFIMHDFVGTIASTSDKDKVVLNDEATEYCWVTPQEALNMPIHIEVRKLLDWYLKESHERITVKNLEILTIIGCLPEEEEAPQKILLDICATLKDGSRPKEDRIEEAINYVTFKEIAERLTQKTPYKLLETLAHDYCNTLLKELPIQECTVEIKKPSAIAGAAYASVKLTKSL